MLNKLKGLYWYFLHSKRIIIPTTKEGWKVLFVIADSWHRGFPLPMEYSSYCLVSFEAVMDEAQMDSLDEVLEYQRNSTQYLMATYSVFPTGPWIKIERAADNIGYKSIGWRQEFEWRPTC